MKLLLLSNSGKPLYQWCKEEIARFAKGETVTFISAATVFNPQEYFQEAKTSLSEVGVRLTHLDITKKPQELIEETKVFLVGGGNTYHLLNKLIRADLLREIRQRVTSGASKYIGISAGANIAGPSILTTNDWNILKTTHFNALNLVPFNINPHYIDPHDKLAFSQESRDDRIFEYFVFNNPPVIALEEKTFLKINDGRILVLGEGKAKLFKKNKSPKVFKSGEELRI